TVTATRNHYTFNPTSGSVSDLSADTTLNFAATLNQHRIIGRVLNGGQPMNGVTINLSGSTTATTVSDSAGDYSFTLNAGGNYTVTAVRNHYTFNPTNGSINDRSADTSVNFA